MIRFWLAVTVHLLVLYVPRSPSPPSGLPLDKVVHAAIFGAVLWTALRAGLPGRAVAAVLAGHAVLSEWLQAAVLPGRSGDAGDVLADLAGIGLAGLLWVVVVRRTRRGRGGTPVRGPGPAT